MEKSKKLFRLVFLPLVLLLISAAGCENGLFSDEDKKKNFWEVHINDQQKMIRETLQGIEFKYCLLNEDTVPANILLRYIKKMGPLLADPLNMALQ